jgi:hypothetical protein
MLSRMYEKTGNGFPSIISLFSAPEYFPYHNDAAILVYTDNSIIIKKFYHTVHPYYLYELRMNNNNNNNNELW